MFICWSSTTDGLETIFSWGGHGGQHLGKGWENGEVRVVACVGGAMVEDEARHKLD